jgi:hypothetical protein
MIWAACDSASHIDKVSGVLYRLVESQEQVATMGYVDTLDEQAMLEDMLEQAKPAYPLDIAPYHYLLTTPFRYPPLQWGSRFGRVNEPSLFYAGCKPSVALAESAFYRFTFLTSMADVTTEDKIRSEHTLFSVDYRSQAGVQLQLPPFTEYQLALTDPKDYSSPQQLGSDMRSADVEVFEYTSARDPNNGICIALYNTLPFRQHKPKNRTKWLCETTIDVVSFKQLEENEPVHFSISDFLVDGVLPLPA